MDIICEHCEHVFNKDIRLNGIVVEEYKNIYGCICPNCGKNIEPILKPIFIENLKNREEILKLEVLKKIKEKVFKEGKNGNS